MSEPGCGMQLWWNAEWDTWSAECSFDLLERNCGWNSECRNAEHMGCRRQECRMRGMRMQNVALTFWNTAVAGMQDAKKFRMHGMQNGARPQQPTCRPARAQMASRASTAVQELVKLGNPRGGRETPAAWDWLPPSHWCRLTSSGRRHQRLLQPSLAPCRRRTAGLWEFFGCCSVFLGVA